MGHLRNWLRSITPNPFLSVLKKLPHKASIVLFWNRGLGDIPLELFALTKTIFDHVSDAEITIITREDLYQGFTLLDPRIHIKVSSLLKRKAYEDYDKIFDELSLLKSDFDHIFYKPDPAYWVKKQKKGLPICLAWQNAFFKPLGIEIKKPKAFLHIHSETIYGFEKNLPASSWNHVIADLKQKGYYTIALGFNKHEDFDVDCDLRGKTDLYQILSSMMTGSSLFIGPDSGLLNMIYYLDVQHTMHLVSFWANTDVGLIKQGTVSPNQLLTHNIVIAQNQNLSKLDPSEITKHVPSLAKPDLIYHKAKLSSALVTADLIEKHAKLLTRNQAPKTPFINIQNPEHTEIEPAFEQSDKLCPIILAGGHGTRLNFHLPKALFTICGKPLIEHLLEKIKQASIKLSFSPHVILIVSQDGFAPIQDYLHHNNFFGLDPKRFHLIIQNNLPFMNSSDQFVMKDPDSIYEGPNGNGEIFSLLKTHGIFELLDNNVKGFEIIPIDNPLAPVFLKNHIDAFEDSHQVSVLAINNSLPSEKLGKLCKHDSGIGIIEYTQNPPSYLNVANTGLLAFEILFAKKLADKNLPLHTAYKQYSCFNGEDYETLMIKKFETFIFDNLKWAKKIKIFTTSRSYIFQPLKEKIGPYGIEAVEHALNQMVEPIFLVKKGEL